MSEEDQSPSVRPPDRVPVEAASPIRAERRSPVDLPEEDGDGARPLAWTSGVISLAAGYLLVANAVSLDGWIAEQPPSPLMAHISDTSAAWLAGTDATGLGAPRDALHQAWKGAEAARFPGQAPAEGP